MICTIQRLFNSSGQELQGLPVRKDLFKVALKHLLLKTVLQEQQQELETILDNMKLTTLTDTEQKRLNWLQQAVNKIMLQKGCCFTTVSWTTFTHTG